MSKQDNQPRGRAQQAQDRAAAPKKRLPALAKFIMYACVIWNAIGGALYISGLWAAKTEGCTVAISVLDSFMRDSVMLAGIVGVIMMVFSFFHLEN
tara:strand:- start:4498 stop:4785 length:288 start_codon:yes stop_codon:yes gene_type:complete